MDPLYPQNVSAYTNYHYIFHNVVYKRHSLTEIASNSFFFLVQTLFSHLCFACLGFEIIVCNVNHSFSSSGPNHMMFEVIFLSIVLTRVV